MSDVAPSSSADALDQDERELLRVLAEGVTAEVAARRLHISTRTLRRRTRRVCERLGVDNTTQAIVVAARAGIV